MNCSSKGCRKMMTPYIDPKTDKVYCSACDNEMENITYFTKMQLKGLKQFRPKKVTPFAVKCDKCNKEDCPILINNEVVCSSCHKILDKLSIPFRNMLKEKLKKPSDV